MLIPFIKRDKGVDEQVMLFRALQTDIKVRAVFFEKQESKVVAAITKRFSTTIGNNALELLSHRDIYHESIVRFYDAIQLRRLFESEGKLFYRDRSGVVGEFKGTLGNYLQCIAKNVFLEKYRDQLECSGIPIDEVECIEAEDFTQERQWRIDAVHAVINNMAKICRVLLLEFLKKDTTKKTDADIAKQLHYKNVNSVKTQRNRCMNVFKSAITKKNSKLWRMIFLGISIQRCHRLRSLNSDSGCQKMQNLGSKWKICLF